MPDTSRSATMLRMDECTAFGSVWTDTARNYFRPPEGLPTHFRTKSRLALPLNLRCSAERLHAVMTLAFSHDLKRRLLVAAGTLGSLAAVSQRGPSAQEDWGSSSDQITTANNFFFISTPEQLRQIFPCTQPYPGCIQTLGVSEYTHKRPAHQATLPKQQACYLLSRYQ